MKTDITQILREYYIQYKKKIQEYENELKNEKAKSINRSTIVVPLMIHEIGLLTYLEFKKEDNRFTRITCIYNKKEYSILI